MATHLPNITVPIMAPQPAILSPPPISHAFEDDIAQALLSPSAQPRPSNPTAPLELPVLASERPLPLTDARRQHPFPPTAIQLTAPGGSVYGGPGPSRDMLVQQGQKLVDDYGFANKKQLLDYLAREIGGKVAGAEGRAQRRVEAKEGNARWAREVRNLEVSFETERRAMERLAKRG
jgi:hypothetical protein